MQNVRGDCPISTVTVTEMPFILRKPPFPGRRPLFPGQKSLKRERHTHRHLEKEKIRKLILLLNARNVILIFMLIVLTRGWCVVRIQTMEKWLLTEYMWLTNYQVFPNLLESVGNCITQNIPTCYWSKRIRLLMILKFILPTIL